MYVVIRMQNAEGRGPYIGYGGSCNEWTSGIHDSTTGHPTPNYDDFPEEILTEMRNNYDCEWLCGFKDYNQAYAWFSEVEIARLVELGFYLVECYAERIVYGGHQVLFKKFTKESE